MPCTAEKPEESLLQIALPIALILALSGAIIHQTGLFQFRSSQSAVFEPQTITVPARSFSYRSDGEFVKGTIPVDAPMKTVAAAKGFEITKFQVSAAEYAACVLEGACVPADAPPEAGRNLPVTGVSFDDAMAYARWLSDKTGDFWTLPSDEQLAQAASKRFPDDALGLDPDNRNPALRWLADYEREARESATRNPEPQPVGAFGENEFGLADFGGNVWEWTTTCHRRVHLYKTGSVQSTEAICGIYVTVGAHRSPMSSFVRNPKGGGCAVGTPPDNLGFRLVKSAQWYAPLLIRLRKSGWAV